MFYPCVKVGIQNMQKFYAISLTNGRPDLTTENHWIKKFHWTHFFWLNKKYIFYTKKNPVGFKIFLNKSVFWLNINYIFFEWQNLYIRKIFFSLNRNIYSFLDKKILNMKMYFCNISATIVKYTILRNVRTSFILTIQSKNFID